MEKRIVQAFLFLFICFSSLFAQQPDTAPRVEDSLTRPLENPFISFQLQTRDNKKILLQWTVQPGLRTDYFTIERNVDGKSFETIGVIKSTDGTTRYEFTDEIPTRGNSLYRIRFTNKEGANLHSDSVAVNLPGSALFSYYPNPVDNVMIIRSAFAADIVITDGLGKTRISRSVGIGPTVIDVSALEKGVYLLRITDKLTSQQQVEKILKN